MKKESLIQRKRRERLESQGHSGAAVAVANPPDPVSESTTEKATSPTNLGTSKTTNRVLAKSLAEKAISTATTGVILRLNPNRTSGIHHIKLLALGRTGFIKHIDISGQYDESTYPTGALVEFTKEHTGEITIGKVLNTTTSELIASSTPLFVITPSALATFLQTTVGFDSATTFDVDTLDLNVTGTAVVNGEVCLVVTSNSVLVSTVSTTNDSVDSNA